MIMNEWLSDCGFLSPPENAVISFTTGIYGTTTLFANATYVCDVGFEVLTPPATRMCTVTSEWYPVAPNCTRGMITFD